MTLGSKLLKLRNELNLTQSEMAKIIDTSQGNYCDWESNKSKPNFDNLLKICTEFKVDVYDLLKEEDKNVVNKTKTAIIPLTVMLKIVL
jgi:transcriptional regulator with XRE-family HTH domain